MSFLDNNGLSHFYNKLKEQFIQAVAGAVTEEEIDSGAVTENKIGTGAVTTNKIGTGAVTEPKIDNGAITTNKIGTGAVTDEKLANAKADLDSNSKVKAAQASSSIISVTENKILSLTDAGKFLNINSTSDITITIPTNTSVAFPVGTEIEFCRYNTGTVTFAETSGVTLASLDSAKTISGRYCCVGLKKIDTDTWILSGALG